MSTAEVEALDLATWPIFAAMSERGLRVDRGRVYALYDEVVNLEALELDNCRTMTGRDLNPASAAQVAAWCQDAEIPLTKYTPARTRLATDERSLSAVRYLHPAIDAILAYRGLQKLRSTFLEPLRDVDEIRPRWRLTKVASGRVSMEDPNLLAFPNRDELGNRVRACFVARPGHVFLSCDYSQVEPRVAAALSGDEALCGIYERGEDLYTSTAAGLFRIRPEHVDTRLHRLPAKTTTLGVLYGIGAEKLYEELVRVGCGTGAPWVPHYSVDACQGLIESWFRLYPGVKALVASECRDARVRGNVALTRLGRERHLPALCLEGGRWPEGKLRQEAERQGFNHLIQGTAQEIIKAAMVRVHKAGWPDVHPLLQIHDEMIYEVEESRIALRLNQVEMLMSDTLCGVSLPAKATTAYDWGGLK